MQPLLETHLLLFKPPYYGYTTYEYAEHIIRSECELKFSEYLPIFLGKDWRVWYGRHPAKVTRHQGRISE